MDLGLEDKTVYITGAGSGIGRAIANLFAEEGARIIGVDANRESLSLAASAWGEQPLIISADLATEEGATGAASEAIEKLGDAPDIVINNVGGGGPVPFEEIPDERWHRIFDLNMMSSVRTNKILLPAMARRGHGSVVNIASDLAHQPEAAPSDYAAAKAAVISLTKSLAITYAPQVRVNAVSPGTIWTEFWTRKGGLVDQLSELHNLPPEEAVQKSVDDRGLLLRRVGQPEEVAAVVAFIASPRCGFVTGTTYSVDGGVLRSV